LFLSGGATKQPAKNPDADIFTLSLLYLSQFFIGSLVTVSLLVFGLNSSFSEHFSMIPEVIDQVFFGTIDDQVDH
jgi:hypothetical protein